MAVRVPRKGMEGKKVLGLPELLAIGVGGMIGGGIFSMLGLAVSIAGHAAPLAFLIGSLVAFFAGYSYMKLALAFPSDGGSYIYLRRAFPAREQISTLTGWTVVIGYIGTLGLYAFTFGAYGAALLGGANNMALRMALSAAVLLFFMFVNLRSAKTSGHTEDLIVLAKVLLLAVFAVAGLQTVEPARFLPLFNKGVASIFMAGAIIFVAFEGFQLINNAVQETRNPEKNIPRGIFGSIAITSSIYILLAIVAIGNLPEERIIAAEEYALAEAARPVLGNAGLLMVGVAALLSTSSAINATVFGAARLMAEMAGNGHMPAALAQRNAEDVPWLAVVAMTMLGMSLALLGGLEIIASFSSMTFLLVSLAVSVANWRLKEQTGSSGAFVIVGIALMGITISLLLWHLGTEEPKVLAQLAGIYLLAGLPAWFYSRR